MIWQPSYLKNEWVELVPLQEQDFEELYRVAQDPLIWEQHPNPDRYKREVFQTYFEGAMLSKGAFLIRNINMEVIGCSRFYGHNPDLREVNIGYTFFSRNCWGKPYNSSAKTLMLQYAFQFVDAVIFHVGINNIRSQKALEKLGAIHSGGKWLAYYGETPKENRVYRIEAPPQSSIRL